MSPDKGWLPLAWPLHSTRASLYIQDGRHLLANNTLTRVDLVWKKVISKSSSLTSSSQWRATAP